jgi:hypothetical protein
MPRWMALTKDRWITPWSRVGVRRASGRGLGSDTRNGPAGLSERHAAREQAVGERALERRRDEDADGRDASTPPSSRLVFTTAEATPARSWPTEPITADVIDASVIAQPIPTITNDGRITEAYDVSPSRGDVSRERPPRASNVVARCGHAYSMPENLMPSSGSSLLAARTPF